MTNTFEAGRSLVVRWTARLAIAALAFPLHAIAQSKEPTTLVVAALGGSLGATLKEIYEPFEKQFNVTIRWVPGSSSTENVARVAANPNKPEFDIVFGDNMVNHTGSKQGLWATIDESIVTNYKDQSPRAKVASKDIIYYGFFLTGLFYQEKEFAKRGWAPPKRWDDLFRPEFCNRIGILHPNVSYGLNAVLMLAGGDPSRFDAAVSKLASNKECIAVLEPTVAQLDAKLQLGEHLVGAYGTIRVIPLLEKGAPIRFVVPEEGGVLSASAFSPVKNSAHPRLVQEFCNWILRPESQLKLMQKAMLSPTNMTVKVPAELAAKGVPTADDLRKAVHIPEQVITDNRRAWVRQIERAVQR